MSSSMTFWIVSLLVLSSTSKLTIQKNKPLMTLIAIEMLSVSLILITMKTVSYSHNSIMSPIFIMVIIVIEATLGLTVLINTARQTSASNSSNMHLSSL